MNYDQLVEEIKKKKSFLCIGLDSDIEKIPEQLKTCDDPLYEFNKKIIDATHHLCIAYKPNIAFYESLGPAGLQSLKKTLQYIPPNIFTIADAKRGDIGNTSEMYAKTFFDYYNFDAVTVAPYMGKDSITPFLKTNKWVILLALTSNEGSSDFQMTDVFSNQSAHKEKLYECVLRTTSAYGDEKNMMYVIGATRAGMIADIRKIIPNHFILVPGVGTQGGSLKDVCNNGLTKDCALIVNSSRQIIYASSGKNFAEAAYSQALTMQQEMQTILKAKKIIN